MSDILERLETVLPRYYALKEREKTLIEQRDALLKRVGDAKKHLEVEPEIKKALEKYQFKKHQDSIGLYESLLTQLVNEILPEQADEIEFDLRLERNAPVLDIYLGKNVNRKDIMTATGGSLANILSTGLRVISLMRANLRQFIVFDEADCWLETKRIPAFARLIHEICTDLNMQSILISHHEPDIFSDLFDATLLLSKDKTGKVQVRNHSTPEAMHWDPERPGIRYLKAVNFMIHEDTCVEFAPGSNVLFGPNHHGKSALLQALRSISSGEGRDEWIRKGADFYELEIGIEENQSINVRRVLKTSAKSQNEKMVYTLKKDGALVRSAASQRGTVPDFIADILNIRKVDDLDIQLQHQKEPVFLLNEAPSKRAKVLSSETNANYLQNLMENSKQLITHARSVVRQGELDLNVLNTQIEELSVLGNIDDALVGKLRDTSVQYQLSEQRFQTAMKLKSRWEKNKEVQFNLDNLKKIDKDLHLPDAETLRKAYALASQWIGIQKRLSTMHDIQDDLPSLPVIDAFKKAVYLNQQWDVSIQELKKYPTDIQVPKLPDVVSLRSAIDCGKKWRVVLEEKKKLHVFLDVPVMTLPKVKSLADASRLGKKWYELRTLLKKENQEMSSLENELLELNQEKEDCVHQNGICIFCGKGEA